MARRKLDGKRCLLTGASSGIGAALAHALAAEGGKILLTARREQRLHELAKKLSHLPGTIDCLPGDITSAPHRQALLDRCQSQFGGLDVLINNAGVGAVGPFAEAEASRLNVLLDVNFMAPVELIRSSLPMLMAGKHPVIVNIGSVLGHFAVPHKSEYCASKFALRGFSEALRAELYQQGIDVVWVAPSTTETEFFDQLVEDRSDGKRMKGMSPAEVADHCVAAIQRGSAEKILSWGGKFLVWFNRFLPGLYRVAARRFP